MADINLQHVNNELLKQIPKNAKTIIEVGCTTGDMCAAYKQYNPFCTYYGITSSDEDIPIADGVLDRILRGNCNDLSLADILSHFSLEEGDVDCLIYHDAILEFVEPIDIVTSHLPLLHDEGIIAASFPNISHWTILHQLLHGQFNYQKDRLTKPSFLRFFSDKNVADLFSSLSLHITKRSINLLADEQEHQSFFQNLAPLVKAQTSGLTEQYAQSVTRIYKYLATAQRNKPAKTLQIQSMMLKPVGAVNDVRIIEPHYFLTSLPDVVATQQVQDINLLPDECPSDELRLFIWHRPIMSYGHAIPILKKIIARNYLVVVEFDDDIDHWPLAKQEKYLTLTGCHAVQTTNETIASFFREHNPEVGIFPNQLAKLPPKQPFNNDKQLRIFFGAIGRENDWKPIFPSIQKLIKRFKNLNFQVIHDREFFDLLPTKNKVFTPLCDYSQYQEILASCDIALLPLEDTRFNHMKSDLKFLECAAHGTAVIAPPVVYSKTIKHNENGLIYSSFDEFEALFAKLAEDTDLRKSLVDNAYEYVKNERLLCLHYMERYRWYMSLFERREELHKALLTRVPELAD